ncbi:MAG: amidohydrolase [Chloroflexota bacterium]|nr:amidohydrolase [Chloroflexota bacterium]MDQ3688494.1 amidohydrolase [Chloroflexota bacterium]
MSADLLITGRIATLKGRQGFGWVEAIAIRDGRITAAGSRPDVERLAGRAARRWRLDADQAVLPGLTDSHLHLATAAIAAQELSLDDAPDREAIFASVRSAHERLAAKGDAGAWLLGHGWSLDRLGDWPTAQDLDRLAPGRPAALWSHDHHSRWVSSAALDRAGIGEGTPDPQGGMIRRDADGRPSGILHEHAAKLVSVAVPEPDRARLAAALSSYAAALARLGIVAVHDPGEMSDDPEIRRGPTFFRGLAEEGALPLRVAASIRPEQLAPAIERGFRSGGTDAPAGSRSGAGADRADPLATRLAERYRGGWLKLFADGSLGSRSAALLEPYEPGSGTPVGGPAGMLLAPPQWLHERAQSAARAGIAVQIHGIGDAAVRSALDILERLPPPADGIHHRVEHAQLVHPADVARFGAAGIVASVQPVHLVGDALVARAAWGDRVRWSFPIRSLAAGGALIAFGTDAPVESPDPWPGIAIAVTRASETWAAGESAAYASESIDLARAIRAACLDPALTAGEVDRGRLVQGHRADLVMVPAEMLDADAVAAGALDRARPLMTLLDGETVYRDARFDPGD